MLTLPDVAAALWFFALLVFMLGCDSGKRECAERCPKEMGPMVAWSKERGCFCRVPDSKR